jgi:large subunit ribosomal protein L35
MSKQKTVKAIAKRFRITKTGKVKKVASGQNHYNSRESGKVKRNKRMDRSITNKKQQRLIKKLT